MRDERIASSPSGTIARPEPACSQFRAMVERSPDGVVLLDPEGRFVYLNREGERWAGPREAVLGRTFLEVFPAAAGSEFEAAFERVRAGGGAESFDRYRGSDGHRYLLDLLPLVDGVGVHFRNVDEQFAVESRWRGLAERLEVVLEASGQGWYELDVTTGESVVSEAYWTIHGEPADRDPMSVDEWSGRIHPEDRDPILAQVGEVIAGRKSRFENEYRFRRADGEYRWIADLGRIADRGPEGRAVRIVGAVRDVTQRKESDIALRRSEEEHRRLFETMAQGAIYQDAEGRILRANPAAEEILGLSQEELVGRASVDTRRAIVREDGRPLPVEEHPGTVALRTGREVDRFVMGVPHPDENRLRWILVNARPLFREGEDRPYQVYTTFTDITAQRESESALRRSEEKYRAFVDNSPDIVSRIDRDLRTLFVSGSVRRYLPGGPGVVVGRRIPEIEGIPDGIGHDLEAAVARVFEDGRPREESLQFSGPEGTVYFAWRLFPELDSDGEVVTVVSVVQDETEQRRLEEQVREAQKMEAIGQLAGGVAHDFNNLLTVLRGHADLALGSIAEGDPIREDLEEVVRAADRASTLTRQLLAFGRRQVMEAKVVDLGAVVSGMETMLRRLIGEHIVFGVEVEPDLRPVRVDPGQMEQVVMNLVVNARDAVGDGGTIRVRVRNGEAARPGDDWVRLEVEDDGEGMEPATLDRIFEPFYTTKENGKGTGLGLSTVYGIVRQSRGRLDVRSEPGMGSLFTVDLPAVDAPVGAEPEPGEDGDRGVASVSGTILVVEDETAVRRLARRVLETTGYRVLEADGPAEALEILADEDRGPIDLLLTDVVMPGMNGKDLASRVRERAPRTRVLLMSGYDAEAAESGGADLPGPLLMKPFSPGGLARAVADALA